MPLRSTTTLTKLQGDSILSHLNTSFGRNRHKDFFTEEGEQETLILPELSREESKSIVSRKESTSSLEDSCSEFYESLSHFKWKPRDKHHHAHIDESFARLNTTKFMQELNTLSIERRRTDFK